MSEPQVLLNYVISTTPSPLNASTTSSQTFGVLKLVVSAPAGQTIYCSEIDVWIPSKALSQSDSFTPTVNTDKWQYSVGKVQNGRDIGIAADDEYVSVKFTCKSSQDYLLNYPLVLSVGISNVTTTAGVVENLYIAEIASTTPDPSEKAYKNFALTVVNAEFYLRDFVASKKDSTSNEYVPCGNFANGEAIRLSWQGNGMNYQVLVAPGNTPIYNGPDSFVILPNGLTDTTTFVLVASQTDSVRSETLYLYESLTVRITNPDLTPNTASISGSTTIGTAASYANLNVHGSISGIGICPPGSIMMFYGDLANFDANGTGNIGGAYEGWQLCNGLNHSPDLRDRFIVAAGGNYNIGATGGTDSVALNLDQMPSHDHSGQTGAQNLWLNYGGVEFATQGMSEGIMLQFLEDKDWHGNRPNSLSTRGREGIKILPENHIHRINAQGGCQAHENRPQYYALAFIMKL